MEQEAIKTHKCSCQRNWDDIEFMTAEMESDGRLAISHSCDEHEDETCVHLLSPSTAELIKAAICRD